MGRRKKIGFSIEEVIRFSNYLKVEKPFCPLLISVILLGWAVERQGKHPKENTKARRGNLNDISKTKVPVGNEDRFSKGGPIEEVGVKPIPFPLGVH
ncbi:hypothetical protein CRG98_032164 [Punica granatum]|uniref:Uncharacterized protein n=1 Tax=Punica granatum TaxID=22663 RepID=A0A2I0ITY0_PUNGR|nr:hypothetical protein CRG98_032164 [Punica granatum]